MPRKPIIRSATLPYHVTARCNNREPFPLPISEVWKILSDHCFEATLVSSVQIHAFLLMPNHFHLLLTTPERELSVVMQDFMRSATKTINRISDRSGRIFGARYYGSLIDSPYYFAHAYKYVYRNPVRAKVTNQRVEEYPFSTLYGVLGREKSAFPLYYPYNLNSFHIIPNETEAMLNWLNQPFLKEQEEAIRRGFRRTLFGPSKMGWTRTHENLQLIIDAASIKKVSDTF